MPFPSLDKEVMEVPATDILHYDDGVPLLYPEHLKHLHHVFMVKQTSERLQTLLSYYYCRLLLRLEAVFAITSLSKDFFRRAFASDSITFTATFERKFRSARILLLAHLCPTPLAHDDSAKGSSTKD